jgi:periplasmic protein TonB
LSYLDPPDSGRRLTGIAVVAVFHLVLIYALVTGLARKLVEVVIPPLETKLIEEVKPPPVDNKPPPPPPPKFAAPPPPFIPPPEVRIDTPPPVANTITAVSDVKPAAEAPMPQPVQPRNRTAAVVEASGCAKPEYPAASLRAHETGIVVLSMLVGADGDVMDSKVLRSSGSRRLDDAARKGLSLCHFRPATADGKPEQSWARIEYEWKID